jgi:hypothetical protein
VRDEVEELHQLTIELLKERAKIRKLFNTEFNK